LAAPRDHDVESGQLPPLDVAAEVGVDAGQSRRIEAELLGRRGAFERHASRLGHHAGGRPLRLRRVRSSKQPATVDSQAAEANPAGALARAVWMAATSARAASSVSSTATRAEGPWPGLAKSIFTVCPYGACCGWST